MNPYMELPLLNQHLHRDHRPAPSATDMAISTAAYRSASAIETLMHRLIDGYRERRRLRRAITELSALDDRTLLDIGIDRSEIPSVVLEGQRGVTADRVDRSPHRAERIVSRARSGPAPANDNRAAPGRREIA